MKSKTTIWIPVLCLLFVVLLVAAPLWMLPIAGAVYRNDSHKNDFTAAVVDKYDRLNSLSGKKIVFVGGSSLPFGLCCSLVEEELPEYEAVDFGVYAALGTVVMMDLSLSGIGEGDIVVLAPETDPQLYSDYYDAKLFREAIGSRTDLLSSLSVGRRKETALAYYPALYERLSDRNNPTVPESELYARSSFDEYGDIAVRRTRNKMSNGYDASKTVDLNALENRGFFDEVNEYAKKVREKGATLIFWFSPINRAAADFTDAEAEAFTAALSEKLDCPLLGSVGDTVYDSAYFYDTNYHLNDDGAVLHTAATILKLKRFLQMDETVSFEIPEPPVDDSDESETISDGTFLYVETWGTLAIVDVEEERRLALTDVVLPESFNDLPVTDLRSECFAGCRNMTSLTLPACMESIGSDVFSGCGKLTEIKITGTSPSLLTVPESGAFEGASPALVVYVPESAIGAFNSSYSWMNYSRLFAPFNPNEESPAETEVQAKSETKNPWVLILSFVVMLVASAMTGLFLVRATRANETAITPAKNEENRHETA